MSTLRSQSACCEKTLGPSRVTTHALMISQRPVVRSGRPGLDTQWRVCLMFHEVASSAGSSASMAHRAVDSVCKLLSDHVEAAMIPTDVIEVSSSDLLSAPNGRPATLNSHYDWYANGFLTCELMSAPWTPASCAHCWITGASQEPPWACSRFRCQKNIQEYRKVKNRHGHVPGSAV